ncbi:MAG: hypothetical protein ACREWG_12275 [Gammaproteobacteria bacterium]
MKSMRFKLLVLWVATSSLLAAASASAYIGPGSGLSAIGSMLALLAATMVAIFGFIWYPLKRLLRKRKEARGQQPAVNKDDETKK